MTSHRRIDPSLFFRLVDAPQLRYAMGMALLLVFAACSSNGDGEGAASAEGDAVATESVPATKEQICASLTSEDVAAATGFAFSDAEKTDDCSWYNDSEGLSEYKQVIIHAGCNALGAVHKVATPIDDLGRPATFAFAFAEGAMGLAGGHVAYGCLETTAGATAQITARNATTDSATARTMIVDLLRRMAEDLPPAAEEDSYLTRPPSASGQAACDLLTLEEVTVALNAAMQKEWAYLPQVTGDANCVWSETSLGIGYLTINTDPGYETTGCAVVDELRKFDDELVGVKGLGDDAAWEIGSYGGGNLTVCQGDKAFSLEVGPISDDEGSPVHAPFEDLARQALKRI